MYSSTPLGFGCSLILSCVYPPMVYNVQHLSGGLLNAPSSAPSASYLQALKFPQSNLYNSSQAEILQQIPLVCYQFSNTEELLSVFNHSSSSSSRIFSVSPPFLFPPAMFASHVRCDMKPRALSCRGWTVFFCCFSNDNTS